LLHLWLKKPGPGPKFRARVAFREGCSRSLVIACSAACNAAFSAALLIVFGASVAAASVDFSATSIVATPTAVLRTELLTVDAVITNTGDTASGSFVVYAWLYEGTDCDGNALFVGEQTMSSLEGGAFENFQVSRIVGEVPATGTHYVCIELDADQDVVESDETNNLVGGTSVPVEVAGCFSVLDCEDNNACTDDSCDLSSYCQNVPNTLSCDDGLFCTVNDACEGGHCQSGLPRVCIDSDLCDGTQQCDEQAGACVEGQPPLACDDGNACNGVETCNPVDGLCLPGTPISCDVLVNNGLSPPTAANLIDHATYDAASGQLIYLRNQGCPPSGAPDDPCPSPGAATTLEVATLGEAGDLEVFDTSLLEVTGGSVLKLASATGSLVDIRGGVVETADASGTTLVSGGDHGFLKLLGPATISGGTIVDLELDSDLVSPGGTVRGGEIMTLFSGTASEVRGGRIWILCAMGDPGTIYGSDFTVNAGMFGPIPGASGFVSGTLESGDPLNATYYQTGAKCYHPVDGAVSTSGSFTLLPPESTFVANGLAPPNAQNVFDASVVATQFHDVFIRSAGCPDLWPSAYPADACTSPGAATSVEVVGGAVIPGSFSVLDSSVATIRGGQVADLLMSAGARIEIWGEGFSTLAGPVPFGELVATSGTLMGTLASGDPLVASFDREDQLAPGTFGTIVLKAGTTLAAGNNVTGSLLGGLGNAGGVAFDVDVENGGTLTGTYEVVALEDISQAVPDGDGLVIAAGSNQSQYEIWTLDFSGDLLAAGTSQVTLRYNPNLVPPGQLLTVFAWNGVDWVIVEDVSVFTFNSLITFDIDAFSIFALIMYQFAVPALSLFGMLMLVGGLAFSGIKARSQRKKGSGV